MAEEFVLWNEVNQRLPLAQDPKSRDARKDLFKSLLKKGKKTLTLDDLQKGMKTLLRHDMAGSYVPGIKEMTKTIKFAFKASSELGPAASPSTKAKAKAKGKDEGGGKTVDKKEFHSFLIALKNYLEIAEFFEQCDGSHDDDQKLSYREVAKGQEKLTSWGISQEMLKEKFPGDAWVACMKYDEFAEWIMGVRMAALKLKLDDSDDDEVQLELGHSSLKKNVDLTFEDLGAESDLNRMKVTETFKTWDSDGSGGITREEMAAVMMQLNPDFTAAKVDLLFNAADVNSDGLIDFEEFLAFVFR